jgi:hypothetical protein
VRSASWYVELYNFVRASEREPRVDALIFSEPVQAGPADGLERRVAAMDRAARGSVVPAAAQSFHEPVPSFPHIHCREFDVCASPGEPVYRCLSCVHATGNKLACGAVMRTSGRWSVSCRCAVASRPTCFHESTPSRRARRKGRHAGYFCSGSNTKSILHVRFD